MAADQTSGAVTIEKTPYFGQPNCYKLSNGSVDVIVTSDIGPRIIAYRLSGKGNILAEMPPDPAKPNEWQPYGGHRLWHAPESIPRTYAPDNKPVKVTQASGAVTLLQDTESTTGIQKEMKVALAAQGSQVTVTHKLTNNGLWPVTLAPWGLTIVKGGGEEFVPQEPYISHDDKLLPARPLVLWNYTNLADSRLTHGRKFMRLRTDKAIEEPNKLGVLNTLGWVAYAVDEAVFIKRFPYDSSATYPDMGINYATYTSGLFMEIESMGPVDLIDPGKSVTHVEHWYLFESKAPSGSDEAVANVLEPLVRQTREAR